MAYSLTPITRGASVSGAGNASSSRNTALRLTDTPKILAIRAQARPAGARPTAASVERNRSVHLLCRRVSPDICSTNVRRPHESSGQKNLRTRRQRTTLRPAPGTSAGKRRQEL
jgi:hypothetical protein